MSELFGKQDLVLSSLVSLSCSHNKWFLDATQSVMWPGHRVESETVSWDILLNACLQHLHDLVISVASLWMFWKPKSGIQGYFRSFHCFVRKKIFCFLKFSLNLVCVDQPNAHSPPLRVVRLRVFWLYDGAKWFTFSGNHTSNFEFWSFPGQWYWVPYSLVTLGSAPQLPVSPPSQGWTTRTLTTTLYPHKHSVFHFQYSIQ